MICTAALLTRVARVAGKLRARRVNSLSAAPWLASIGRPPKRTAAALARAIADVAPHRARGSRWVGGADKRYRPVLSTRRSWHRVSGGSAEDGTGRWTRRGTRAALPRST